MIKRLYNRFLKAWKSPRWRWTLLIAAVSDALGFGVALFPPVQWVLDAITAIILLVVLGFRWTLFIALAVEVIPGIQLFPAWTLWVLATAANDNKKSLQSINTEVNVNN